MEQAVPTISAEQVKFFNLFGYLVLPGLFVEEIKKISKEYQAVFEQADSDVIEWEHQAHYGKKRKVLPQFIDRSAYLSALIDDPRIHNIFSALLGDDFSYRGSDANIFESSTVWHSDTYGALFDYLNVKIAFYLEEIDENTGCMRMIPGSHLFGNTFANTLQNLLGENDSLCDELGVADKDIPAQILPTKPGDVLIFDFRTKHATCFDEPVSQRRSFTICASQRIADKDIPRLCDEIKIAKQFGYKHYYGEQMVETASPERMVHLEQCMAQDYVLRDVLKED